MRDAIQGESLAFVKRGHVGCSGLHGNEGGAFKRFRKVLVLTGDFVAQDTEQSQVEANRSC
jgi:hypothetical protein